MTAHCQQALKRVVTLVWPLCACINTQQNVVACMIDFDLLCDQGKQEGVLKIMKNDHFLAFLVVLVIFSKCLGR